MKQPVRNLLIPALVGMLAALLVWKCWPAAEAPSSSHPTGVVSFAPKTAVLDSPTMPAAKPAAASSTIALLDRAAISAAGGSIDPVLVNYDHNKVSMDFGNVVLTPGVPVHLVLPTGQTGTMTAAATDDGRIQVDVDIQGTAPGGMSTMVHFVNFGDRTDVAGDAGNGEIQIKYSAKLSSP